MLDNSIEVPLDQNRNIHSACFQNIWEQNESYQKLLNLVYGTDGEALLNSTLQCKQMSKASLNNKTTKNVSGNLQQKQKQKQNLGAFDGVERCNGRGSDGRRKRRGTNGTRRRRRRLGRRVS